VHTTRCDHVRPSVAREARREGSFLTTPQSRQASTAPLRYGGRSRDDASVVYRVPCSPGKGSSIFLRKGALIHHLAAVIPLRFHFASLHYRGSSRDLASLVQREAAAVRLTEGLSAPSAAHHLPLRSVGVILPSLVQRRVDAEGRREDCLQNRAKLDGRAMPTSLTLRYIGNSRGDALRRLPRTIVRTCIFPRPVI